MARKRISGRARPTSSASKLVVDLERVNRRLRQLEKAELYGKFSTRKLLRALSREPSVSYKRGRRVEKLRIDTSNLNAARIRYLEKVLRDFLKSPTSTPLGIHEARTETEQKLKQSLKQLTDKDISDQDIDEFYSLVQDDDFRYLADKIGDSEAYILINEAQSRDLDEQGFTKMLNQFMTTNSQEARDIASRLYDKYIGG